MPDLGNSTLVLPPSANVARAFQTTVRVPDPAPGADATYMVTGNYYELVVSVFFELLTDATLGSRQGTIAYADGSGRPFASLAAPNVQPASALWVYTYGVSISTAGSVAAGVQTVTAPATILSPGYTISIGAVNLPGPADQVFNITLVVQRYPTDAAAYAADVADPVPAPLAL